VKHRLLRILLACSLTISLLSLIAWPLSYVWAPRAAYIGRSSSVHCWTAGGQLVWLRQSGPGVDIYAANPGIGPGTWHVSSNRYHARRYDSVDRWNSFRESLRIRVDRISVAQPSGRVVNQRHVTLPYWPIAWLFAMPPAIAFQRHRIRQSRMREGLCMRCGYDLRASGGRCPECGFDRSVGAPVTA
jgi:hypothetical protein